MSQIMPQRAIFIHNTACFHKLTENDVLSPLRFATEELARSEISPIKVT